MSTQPKTNVTPQSFFSRVRSRTSILPAFLLAGVLATPSLKTVTASKLVAEAAAAPLNREERRALARAQRKRK